jgi:hypothetical protein
MACEGCKTDDCASHRPAYKVTFYRKGQVAGTHTAECQCRHGVIA